MGTKSTHYTKEGKVWRGSFHKMPNGTLHTGVKHTSSSQRLYHTKPKKKQGVR